MIHPPTDAEREMEFIRLYRLGTPLERIMQVLKINSEYACRKIIAKHKLRRKRPPCTRTAPVVRGYSKKPDRMGTDHDICAVAKQTLLWAGYSDQALKLMKLDGIMTTANEIRAKYGMPQLGRNPNWLVGES